MLIMAYNMVLTMAGGQSEPMRRCWNLPPIKHA
jgi:hypothetical protein